MKSIMVELQYIEAVSKLTSQPTLKSRPSWSPLTWGRLYVSVRVIRRSVLPEFDCIINMLCVLLQVGA